MILTFLVVGKNIVLYECSVLINVQCNQMTRENVSKVYEIKTSGFIIKSPTFRVPKLIQRSYDCICKPCAICSDERLLSPSANSYLMFSL